MGDSKRLRVEGGDDRVTCRGTTKGESQGGSEGFGYPRAYLG